MFFMFTNTYVKFHINQILFIIQFLIYILCIILDYRNLKFNYLINDIPIDFCSSGNFASMKDIRRKCNRMRVLSKLTFSKKILSSLRLQPSFLPNFVINN